VNFRIYPSTTHKIRLSLHSHTLYLDLIPYPTTLWIHSDHMCEQYSKPSIGWRLTPSMVVTYQCLGIYWNGMCCCQNIQEAEWDQFHTAFGFVMLAIMVGRRAAEIIFNVEKLLQPWMRRDCLSSFPVIPQCLVVDVLSHNQLPTYANIQREAIQLFHPFATMADSPRSLIGWISCLGHLLTEFVIRVGDFVW
jgi:hypothetical protein